MGALIVLFKPVYEAITILGDLDFVLGYAQPVLSFLDSVWGTFSLVPAGFLLIYKASREQHSEENTQTGSEKQRIERLYSENKQLKVENGRLERKLNAESGAPKTDANSAATTAKLMAAARNRPNTSLSDIDLSKLPDTEPTGQSEPKGTMFFIEGYERLRKENEKIKAEKEALENKLRQTEAPKEAPKSNEAGDGDPE
jgi:regulator of replication initiation timing